MSVTGTLRTDGQLYEILDNVRDSIASDYSKLTFPIAQGTYCIQNGTLYVSNQAIPQSETWTVSHWTPVKVTDISSGSVDWVSVANGEVCITYEEEDNS